METPSRDPEPDVPPEHGPQGGRDGEGARGGGEEARGGEGGAEGAPGSGEEAQGAGSSGKEASGAGQAEPRGIPIGALSARDLLMWFLGLLAAKAWEGMGLIPDAATGKIQKNLEEARIAIDAYAAVLDVMRERLDGAQRREVETVLTTLRLNFVEKSGGGPQRPTAQAP